ncbi:ParB N-terminal domain-containing protein [Streptomyces sp. NBC_01565]|uniref:ParB N-terminal domain-containing protein n=1 Tax=unclassified Streptomyces TaxID=2593676 RepID=UPI0022529732|nr:ParB N-terminal domain-containing protein [Streptomyces sp. NBC_01565]MCX4545885.1 ParB N-terminal domain-containing protein [Streptomyces sp. NBC_01565]
MTTARAGRPINHESPQPPRGQRLTSVHLVPISALQPADSPRALTEHAEHLRALAVSEHRLPPIVVHRPTMRVVDGMHRLRAALLRGRSEIEVQFLDGSAEDAFVYAVQCNTRHGLPLTLSERTAAAERILESHGHWADRAIASVAGLSAHTVAALRRGGAGADAPAEGRLGRDGKVRPLSTAQGRREAQRLLTGPAPISLREVAKRTGLSPATVRDVRRRMLRGEDPVPERQRAGERKQRPQPRQPAAASKRGHVRLVPPPDRELTAAYQKLCQDPALRHSDTGRLLLRLLSALTLPATEWRTMAEGVPAHRADTVAELATEYARFWREFAELARSNAL